MRNKLIRLACQSPKVAAMLGSHEHAYHRILVNSQVPLGDPARAGENDPAGRAPRQITAAAPGPYVSYLVHNFRGRGAPLLFRNAHSLEPFWKKGAGLPRQGYYFTSQENLAVSGQTAKVSL